MHSSLVLPAIVLLSSCSALWKNAAQESERKPASARNISCQIDVPELGLLKVAGILEPNHVLKNVQVAVEGDALPMVPEIKPSIYKTPSFMGSRFFIGRDRRADVDMSIVLPMSLDHKEKTNVLYAPLSVAQEAPAKPVWGGCYLD
jgi:hypothetical protein